MSIPFSGVLFALVLLVACSGGEDASNGDGTLPTGSADKGGKAGAGGAGGAGSGGNNSGGSFPGSSGASAGSSGSAAQTGGASGQGGEAGAGGSDASGQGGISGTSGQAGSGPQAGNDAGGTDAGGSDAGGSSAGEAGTSGVPTDTCEEAQGQGPGGCEFPQGVPESGFCAAATSYQDTDKTVDNAVNAVMEQLSGCSAGSDCPITVVPGDTPEVVCQNWFDAVNAALRAQGFCAGQHEAGYTDEIAVSDTGCTGKWYGYHICNYGGPKVVWNPGARRGWWKIQPSYCP